MKNKPLHLALAAIVSSTLGVAASAASFNLPNIDLGRALGVAKDLGTAATPLPEADEIALGRELAGRTMGAAPLIQDRALQSYVNRVGRRIAALSERPDLPWRFGVMDSPGINAFASPGGIILITRGLYEILDNEAQLAAVLGHEVAHVEKYHHASVVRKQAGTSAVAGAGQIALQQRGGALAPALSQALGEGATLFAHKLDRGAELEADHVGALLAARAGYSPAGMFDVLHKLGERAAEPTTKLLYATHPHPRDRLTQLGDLLAPQMASLPTEEPPLQVAGSDLPAPIVTAGQPAARGARALSTEQQQQQPTSDNALGLPTGLMGGSGGGRGGSNPVEGLFRGILGR